MVNTTNANSPKVSYAQVTASPKPRARMIIAGQATAGKTKNTPPQDTAVKANESIESRNVVAVGNDSKPSANAKRPDADPRPAITSALPGTQSGGETKAVPTIERSTGKASQEFVNEVVTEQKETPTTNTTSPGNRFNNIELPVRPRPKSRKDHRKEKRGSKKSPPPSVQATPTFPNPEGKVSTNNASLSPLTALSCISDKDEDDQLTPKAQPPNEPEPTATLVAGGAQINTTMPKEPQTQSPPRIPFEAKGKGKAVPLLREAPRILLLATQETSVEPPLKRKFEDTPSKEKQSTRPVEFQTPSRKLELNKQTTLKANTVDAFTHPSQREEVYADDPEPGVLPEPAYFNETPPFLRYPQDIHMKDLAKLMTNKDTYAGSDFDHRKEGVRLQEMAREAGARFHPSDSESDNDMRVDNYQEIANPPTQASRSPELDRSLPPSPTPQPRQRRPLLPSLDRGRAHSSQGIPVRQLFTNEYEMFYPTQYTRSLGTRSPQRSDDFNQNASEASYTSSNMPSLPSGDYPGIFQTDIEMRDNSPAPPYQGSDASQGDNEEHIQPHQPGQGGNEGQNDPLRAWAPTDTPGEQVNIRDIKITSAPPNGWPEIFIRYLPDHDINEASRHLIELAQGPGSCYMLPFKCSQSKMQQLATIDGFKRTISDLVTLQPGQRVGITPMRTKSQDNERVQESRFAPPHFALVNGLNIDQKEYLVKKSVFIVDKDNSFIMFPMEVKQDLFVGTIAGLHYIANDADIVLDLVKQTYTDHRELKATMATNLANYTPADFDNLINNIRITFVSIGEEGKWNYQRAWNVILPKHRMDTKTTGVFTKIMRHTTFTVLGFGTGTFMDLDDIPHCDGCKSLGHDWQNCPFPSLTGWRGPPPAEKKKKTGVTHDQHDWFNTEDDSTGPSTHRPSSNNSQRGRNPSGRGGQHRGRANMRRNGRGGRRY